MKAHYNNKRVQMFEKGDIVSVRIPRVDRAATDLHRLQCVVVERYYGTFCSCKGNCSEKKCSCQRAHKPCPTHCHSGQSCLNHRDDELAPPQNKPSPTRTKASHHHSAIPTDTPSLSSAAQIKAPALPSQTQAPPPLPLSYIQTETAQTELPRR